MPYSLETLYGDVAQVQHSSLDLFGTGRLIGRNLVLTARHVVTPDSAVPVKTGWQVRLISGRPDPPEVQTWDWIEAKVVWDGQERADLALLALHPTAGAAEWCPNLRLRIGRIEEVQHHSVRGLGFPRGAKVDKRRTLFVPSGTLDDEKGATLSFGIDQAYQPESPNEDWRGFSGAAVLLEVSADPEVVWIYGVAQQVPLRFTRRLEVARLAKAWEDGIFRDVLRAAGIALEPPADPMLRRRSAPGIKTVYFEPETVLISDGPFIMGSPPSAEVPAEETPQHTVTLPAYRIGKYPVTNRQYAEFVKREKGQREPQGSGWFLREPPADRLDHPVVGVSWQDARAYCRWLSAQTGRHYRLPTEAEWEKAARGPEGRIYPWGNTWLAGLCNTGNEGTAPVTAYPGGASPYGCYDFVGNVREWTATRWGSRHKPSNFSYPYCAEDGREDLEANDYRVDRGGSYGDHPSALRCSARGCAIPQSMIRRRGFRVALDI